MTTGICKLCLKQKALQDSHLIPRAMYRYIRDSEKKNSSPVVVGRRITATTSKQVTDYVLCAECEDLFNRNGENWMLRQVWNGKKFPLLNRLMLAHPDYTFREALVFSGTAVGIDTHQLAYFALSVIWRAAVHTWRMPFGGQSQSLNLVSAEEPIRKFLHKESSSVPNLTVMATVCTDRGSIGAFYLPSQVSGIPETGVSFLSLGVHFMLLIEPKNPVVREFCCLNSSRKSIFLRNCESKTVAAFGQLMATSREAKSMSASR